MLNYFANAPLVLDELDAQVAQARAFAPADGAIIAAMGVGRNINTPTPAFVLVNPNQLEEVAGLGASKVIVVNLLGWEKPVFPQKRMRNCLTSPTGSV